MRQDILLNNGANGIFIDKTWAWALRICSVYPHFQAEKTSRLEAVPMLYTLSYLQVYIFFTNVMRITKINFIVMQLSLCCEMSYVVQTVVFHNRDSLYIMVAVNIPYIVCLMSNIINALTNP